MTFPTVVFGSYEVGIGYTDGESIPTGGLRVFVVPTINVIGLDVPVVTVSANLMIVDVANGPRAQGVVVASARDILVFVIGATGENVPPEKPPTFPCLETNQRNNPPRITSTPRIG